jgi:hypothetical protein
MRSKVSPMQHRYPYRTKALPWVWPASTLFPLRSPTKVRTKQNRIVSRFCFPKGRNPRHWLKNGSSYRTEVCATPIASQHQVRQNLPKRYIGINGKTLGEDWKKTESVCCQIGRPSILYVLMTGQEANHSLPPSAFTTVEHSGFSLSIHLQTWGSNPPVRVWALFQNFWNNAIERIPAAMGKSKLPLFSKIGYWVRFRCRRTGGPVFFTIEEPFWQQTPLPPGGGEGLESGQEGWKIPYHEILELLDIHK